MKNKYAGIVVIVIALLLLLIIISFNNALESIVNATCSHGSACPMYATISFQKNISYGFIVLLVAFALYLIFFLKDVRHKRIIRNGTEKLDNEEKKIHDLVVSNKGSMYQSDIIKETGMSKVKISRILDKLEGKRIIVRRRRGMTNMVIIRD